MDLACPWFSSGMVDSSVDADRGRSRDVVDRVEDALSSWAIVTQRIASLLTA
jgi:hypothetical protein